MVPKVFDDDASSRVAKDVTDKKNTHKRSCMDGYRANDPATDTTYFPE
jgi:hypothetical protein